MHVDVQECGRQNRALGDSMGKFLVGDDLPLLNDTCDCLPPK